MTVYEAGPIASNAIRAITLQRLTFASPLVHPRTGGQIAL